MNIKTTKMCVKQIKYINLFVFVLLRFVGVRGQLDRPDGSPCTWENINGTCVDARRCTTFQADVEGKNHPPICSFEGNFAIICCTACVIKNTTQEPTPPPVPRLVSKCREYYARLPYACRPRATTRRWKELNKDKTCYDYYESRSAPVGGQDTLRNQFPHMALLGYGEERAAAQWLCAGSVISERYILTAAHCASQAALGAVRFVGLGVLKRSDPPDQWQVYGVLRFIPHPDYRPPAKYNDIALIHTDRTIEFSVSVMPSCVGEKDLDGQYGVNYSRGYALGWGGLGHRKENADTLQIVTLEAFSGAECSALYPPSRLLQRGIDSQTQMCYGDHNEIKDTCGGDSGGPLIRKHNGISCTNHVVGVTSYGRECGFQGNAGVYTRIQTYEDWIQGIVFP